MNWKRIDTGRGDVHRATINGEQVAEVEQGRGSGKWYATIGEPDEEMTYRRNTLGELKSVIKAVLGV